MKTLKEINDAIASKIRYSEIAYGREKSLALGQIKFLTQCKLYLETNPSEASINRQLASLEHCLTVANIRFKDATEMMSYKSDVFKQYQKKHEAIYQTKQLKAQVKTLKFLLNN